MKNKLFLMALCAYILIGCNNNKGSIYRESNKSLSRDTVVVDTFYYAPEYASVSGDYVVDIDNVTRQNKFLMEEFYKDLLDSKPMILAKVNGPDTIEYLEYSEDSRVWLNIDEQRVEYIKNCVPRKKYIAKCDILKSRLTK